MMRRLKPFALLWLFLLIFSLSALAVTDESEPPPDAPGDPDYAAAVAAFKNKNWQVVIDKMTRVIKRRPWHDEAHNLIGFAYRKLGDYPRALTHYQKALELNPHHLGAMEYLGEAYLEMGCPAQARQMLGRLEAACRRISSNPSQEGWKASCEEWRELRAAVNSPPKPIKKDCALKDTK